MQRKALPAYVHRKRARGHTYYYFDTGATDDNGKRIFRRLPDIADRAEFGPAYAQALAARARRKTVAPIVTFSRAIADWHISPDWLSKSSSTQEVYELYSRELVKLFGKASLDEVERRDVLAMMDRYASTPGRANMMLAVLGSFYRWARDREKTKARPTEDVKPFDSEDYKPWPVEYLTDTLSNAPEHVRLATALLYYTAQRIGDVCQMRWDRIANGSIAVKQKKTDKELRIPLHTDLLAHLPAKHGMTILLNANGTPFTPNTLRHHFNKWTARYPGKLVPHGLRKNAVIALLEAGCSMAETAAISGQTLQLVEHYAKGRNQEALASAAILKWENRK